MATLITAVLRKSRVSAATIQASKSDVSLSSGPPADSSGVTHVVLLKLLSSLQTGFLSWIRVMVSTKQQHIIKTASSLLLACSCSLPLSIHFVIPSHSAIDLVFSSFIHPSTDLLTHSFTHPSTDLLTHSFIYLFIH